MGGDPKSGPFSLGIEGGGTRTVALLANHRGSIVRRFEFGPLNLKLVSVAQVLRLLRRLQSQISHFKYSVSQIAVCLAGCRTETDRQLARQLVQRVWPTAHLFIGSDLDSGFAAAFGKGDSGILVISGTGSCVYGRKGVHFARAGGWGHLLGDHASGYWIALTGLRNAIRDYDRSSKTNAMLRKTLTRLYLNSPDQLVGWVNGATKDEVAGLADIFLHKNKGLLLQAASFLAMDCVAVAHKLHLDAPRVALAGGVLQNNRNLRLWVAHRIRTALPGAQVSVMDRETAEGALSLARVGRLCESAPAPRRFSEAAYNVPLTELRNPRTINLDKRSVSQLIDTMLAEEARVIPVLRKNKPAIERAVKMIVSAFNRRGRLFYIGAGTSGRLGVLDASECPPTFSTNPQMVQAIIAGGATALHSAVEGAEDDLDAGAEAMRTRGVGRRDVVVGIAASGSTPFVLGALEEAKRRGARTFLLCFSRPVTPPLHHSILFFPTGPEILTGSTRLKAGTATKVVLNMLTTISMIRLGKAKSNLMVDVRPTNNKLRDRACRIVAVLKGCSESEARRRLIQYRWNVKKAVR